MASWIQSNPLLDGTYDITSGGVYRWQKFERSGDLISALPCTIFISLKLRDCVDFIKLSVPGERVPESRLTEPRVLAMEPNYIFLVTVFRDRETIQRVSGGVKSWLFNRAAEDQAKMAKEMADTLNRSFFSPFITTRPPFRLIENLPVNGEDSSLCLGFATELDGERPLSPILDCLCSSLINFSRTDLPCQEIDDVQLDLFTSLRHPPEL